MLGGEGGGRKGETEWEKSWQPKETNRTVAKGRCLIKGMFFPLVLKMGNVCTLLGMIAEKAMAPHSSTLAWKILWTEEPGNLQSLGSLRVSHYWAALLSLFTFMHWRRQWQPTPVFLPGESRDGGAWWAAVSSSVKCGYQLEIFGKNQLPVKRFE